LFARLGNEKKEEEENDYNLKKVHVASVASISQRHGERKA